MRRLWYGLLICVVMIGVAGPALSPVAVQAQEIGTATATDLLNLRSGPSLSDRVLTVIPLGGKVQLTGKESNGFRSVSYNGTSGWAFSTYLAIDSAPASPHLSAVTTDALNLRTGPGTSNPVIVVMPKGAAVTLTGKTSGGFKSVTWQGFSGWASAEYLREQGATAPAPPVTPPPTSAGTATTTDALNLRAGAGTSYTVLAVMPRGATVTLTGRSANGFYQVSWGGHTGWASGDYLRLSSSVPPNPAPQPPPKPEPSKPESPAGTAVTTDALNLRASASLGARVLAVMPVKSKVALTGRSQGDFLELSWNGHTGWAHKDYLAIDGTVEVPQTSAVATDDLNLRTGPATSYAVLTVIPNGGTVTLTGQTNNGFHGVKYNGHTGWAFSSYLKTGSAGTAPQPTQPPKPQPTQPPAPQPTQPPAPQPTQPPANIEFDVTNTIIGPVRGTPDETIAFARRAGAERMDEVEKYIREMYRLAPTLGFDPAILIAQSALETGYWKSERWVTELNPAGLGISGNPWDRYDFFESGTNAARAQMAHMHAEVYGRSQALPTVLQGVDPTYEQVFQAGWAGTIRTIEDLSGTWAVDPEYHHKIVRVAREMFGK